MTNKFINLPQFVEYPREDMRIIERWLETYLNNKNTFNNYKLAVERFIVFSITKNISIVNFHDNDIPSYISWLESPSEDLCTGHARFSKEGNWKPFVKGLSQSSIDLNLRIISILFEYLIYHDYIVKNPFKMSKFKYTQQIKQERYLNNEHIEIIFDYLNDQVDTLEWKAERRLWIFNLLYLSGLRKSEAVNAKMNSFEYINSKWWIKVTGKGNKEGKIPAPDRLIEALKRYRVYNKLTALPSPDDEAPLIFTKFNYQPIGDDVLYNEVKSIFNELYLIYKDTDAHITHAFKHASTHWLRHSYATAQTDADIPLHIVKENLRHSNISTTSRYLHADERERHDLVNKKFK